MQLAQGNPSSLSGRKPTSGPVAFLGRSATMDLYVSRLITGQSPLQPRGVRFLERALAGVELLLRLRAPAPAPDLAHVLAQRFFIHGLRPRGDSAGNPASAVARSNTRRWSEIVLCPRGDAGSWDKAGPRATRGSAPGSA